MQTTLEQTRDVRLRRNFDALRMPVRCRLPAVSTGMPRPKRKKVGYDEQEEADKVDNEDDDS